MGVLEKSKIPSSAKGQSRVSTRKLKSICEYEYVQEFRQHPRKWFKIKSYPGRTTYNAPSAGLMERRKIQQARRDYFESIQITANRWYREGKLKAYRGVLMAFPLQKRKKKEIWYKVGCAFSQTSGRGGHPWTHPTLQKPGHTKVFRHLNGTENQFSPVSSFSLACTTTDYRNLPRDLLTQNVFLAQHAN